MTLILEPKRRLSKRDAPQFTTHIESSFDKNELIVSKTDKRGTIISCNDIFAKMSGWSEEELMGSNHNLIRHPDMPQIVYKLAWDTIKAKKEFFGYIKNLRKDGGFYWVFAYITGTWDDDGNITNYTSYRRYAPILAIKAVSPVYQILLEAEKKGGMKASEKVLNACLASKGYSQYDKFIVDLQLKAHATLK
jgi:PAS domain S-box-containing protein